MNRQMAICLRCGNVQVRTDLEQISSSSYIVLKRNLFCPKCQMETRQVATKDVKILKKQLSESIYKPLDTHIFNLIKE